jgi:signal transduction histidine kinase/phage shock protein PspC (stress-responsive transcriptional regulator)
VASGIGHRLGVDPMLVRIGFAVLAFAGGAGIVAYGLLWVLLPIETAAAPATRRPVTLQQGVALGLITLGVLLLLRQVGLWFGDSLVVPILLAAAGSAVVWTTTDEEERSRWTRLPGGAVAAAARMPGSPVRIVVGTVLVAAAIGGFLAANDAFTAVRDLGLALIAAVIGVGLLFGPWLWRLWAELGAERRERIRQEERAELAAHLHDSVLQTLALIQRSADQPRRMVTLARRQERELRTWLYGSSVRPGASPAGHASTLADAVEAVAEEIEATYDLAIEIVVVGDALVDEHVGALLAATREACINAAKHAEVDEADVYVEVEDDTVVAFVRDRGRGFDADDTPADRQGIRRSIVERLERHGGSATIVTSPGAGTEVELCVPRPSLPDHPRGPDPCSPSEAAPSPPAHSAPEAPA